VLVELTAPRPGEHVLDVGTGSGGLALRAAQTGASVTGVDISEDGIARARSLAGEQEIDARFELGDAQALPYDDGAFDVVLSAFGINFAADRRAAAAELARVCRPGGRVGLALIPRPSRAAEMWDLLRSYGGGGEGDHPAAFAEDAEGLLADDFVVETHLREVPRETSPGSEMTWEDSLATFAPLRELVDTLEPDRVTALRNDLRDLFERWGERPASYLLVLGTRR